MFARGNVSKFAVGVVTQDFIQSIFSKYPRHIRRNLVRSCSTNPKEDFNGNVENDSDTYDFVERSGRNENKPHYSNRNSENYDNTRSNFRSRRFSNQYDEDDNRGRGRPFRSRFRHDEDDGQDYSRSQRYDKDIFEKGYKNRFDNYTRARFDNGDKNGFRFQPREKTNYEEFEKDFYTEHEDVKNRSPEEIQKFIDEHEIVSRGSEVLRPISSFEEAGFSDTINSKLQSQRWESPTPIQRITWPQVLSGRDVVGIAQTGSGKTLGFMLPAFVHIEKQEPVRRGDGPVCLVLAPTRELSQQIQSVVRDFGSVCSIQSCIVHGGASRIPQMQQLNRGVHVCIATPGRLLDFLRSGVTNLNKCTYLVLDEADRMLDMGFEPQIRQIIEQIRPDRQTLMWSATWPKEVRELAKDFLNDYVQINVGSTELAANHSIKQEIIVCDEYDKMNKFRELLQKILQTKNEKLLIFVQTKNKADQLSWDTNRMGIRNACLHGDKSQQVRDRTLHDFRSGRTNVLFATDVAARGLDVSDITYVINYDFPNTVEDYIHRIGRTGRAGNTGKAITFFTYDNSFLARDLIKVMREANQEVNEDLLEMDHSANKFNGYRKSRYGKSFGSSRYGNDQSFSQRYSQFKGSKYPSNFERANDYNKNRNDFNFKQNTSRFTKMDDDL